MEMALGKPPKSITAKILVLFQAGSHKGGRDGLERRMWGKFQSEETVSVKVRRHEGPMAV